MQPVSHAELLTGDPRFTGSPHGSSVVSRVVTHISIPPSPPDRVEVKKSDRPSAETLGLKSRDELLIFGTFAGVPKVKSAFTTSAVRTKTKTNKIVFFILLPSQRLFIFSCPRLLLTSPAGCGFRQEVFHYPGLNACCPAFAPSHRLSVTAETRNTHVCTLS
jgi:hypothetical protein